MWTFFKGIFLKRFTEMQHYGTSVTIEKVGEDCSRFSRFAIKWVYPYTSGALTGYTELKGWGSFL